MSPCTDGDENPLTSSPAFAAFQADIGERCAEGPTPAGSHGHRQLPLAGVTPPPAPVRPTARRRASLGMTRAAVVVMKLQGRYPGPLGVREITPVISPDDVRPPDDRRH